MIAPYTTAAKQIQHQRQWRASSSTAFRPRVILVTGVGMSKGLTLARTFYRAGHRVIGADLEPYNNPVCGRFSSAVAKFYRLPKPTTASGAGYISELTSIINKESVELWVSCSGAASQMVDGEAAEAIEKFTACKAIQFGLTLTSTLHDKHSFIGNTQAIGLNVPDSHLATSATEALALLYPEKPRYTMDHRYIMKSVGWDDNTQVDMTLLPMATIRDTRSHIRRINPTPFRPFVLQQYISGPEYCTHSFISNNKVQAFVACPSTEILMHYKALPAASALSQAMLLYTSIYARKTTTSMTGHFSIDFLVDEQIAHNAEQKMDASPQEVRDLMNVIYPIECNPRPNTADVLFADESEQLASAYLAVLPDYEINGTGKKEHQETLVVPASNTPGYYWVGHDLVTMVLLPVIEFIWRDRSILDVLGLWIEFISHLFYWRDGTYEIWDPWPVVWLYLGYWPGMFAASLWEGKKWSKINVSTTKIFGS